MILIAIFSIPFFLENDNIRWGYFVGAVLMISTVIALLHYYSKEKKSRDKKIKIISLDAERSVLLEIITFNK